MSEVTKKSEKSDNSWSQMRLLGGDSSYVFPWEVKICTLQNQGLFLLRILCTDNAISSWASHCNALRHFTCLLLLSCGTSYPDQTTQYTATGYRQGHCHQCVASVLSIRVFKCSAKLGGDCTQPGGPVSPITQHWRIKVSTKFPCII